jgi:hypothetical protein
MRTDRQLDDRISRWLEAEAPTQLPDRVLRATFERTRKARQQGRWQQVLRRLQMNRMIFGLGGAAVVVLAAVLALGIYGSGVGGPGSSPTASPEASHTPAPSPTPAGNEVGEFLLYDGRYGGSVPITVTIPASGWHGDSGAGILVKNDNPDAPDGAGMVGPFAGQVYVYGDPCQWRTTTPDSPATTVDEAVAALRSQPSRDPSEPVDITVDGHAGKSITLHVPDDAVFTDCDRGEFRTLVEDPIADLARYHQDPGQIDEVWILDVNGELMVFFAAYYAGTPAEHVAELRAILESMTFDE